MNVLDYAMQMEQDGETYYRDLAKKSNNVGFTNILNMLADDEVKHYNAFKDLKENKSKVMPESTILANSRNIFAQMKEKKETLADFNLSQKDLYQKALDMEKKSKDFYEEKAAAVTNPAEKEILKKIALEEKKHFILLEGLIDFITRRETWLENAEFTHLEAY